MNAPERPLAHTAVLLLTLLLLGAPGAARAQELYRDGDRSLSVGLWAQGWYQYLQDANDGNGDGERDLDLHDFLVRRVYLAVKGDVTSWLGFFVHIAGDRFGQRGLDNPGAGLGTGLAFRDGWASIRLLDDALIVHVGRMYVPFTRNFGTTSTKALLTTDLDWVQGGYRGGILYPSLVGRDDGITVWGNLAGGLVQYRAMVADGVDEPVRNPGDRPRLAGRLSLSFLEPETEWFTEGSYLGERKVLAVGAGVDHQRLAFDTGEDDYTAWTLDLHYDRPLGAGALTVEGSYINIHGAPNPIDFTPITAGADADTVSLKAGYLVAGEVGPGRLQPFGRYEWIGVDDREDSTHIGGLGMNYFFAGHANKLSFEVTYVGPSGIGTGPGSPEDRFVVTAQIAVGL